MADLKLVGAVAIKVRPEAKGFKGETQRQIKKELAGLEAEVKVKLKVDADTAEAEAGVDKVEKEAKKKIVSLKVGLDHDSVVAAQKQFDALIKNEQAIKLSFDVKDPAELERIQGELDAMKEMAAVEFKYYDDAKGYQTVLDKIAALRREKILIDIEPFMDDDETLDALEAEFKEKLAKATSEGIAEGAVAAVSKIRLNISNDRASMQKAIDQLKTELAKITSVKIDVTADAESVKAQMADLERLIAKTPIKVSYEKNQEGIKALLVEIDKEIHRLKNPEIEIDLALDIDGLEAQAREYRQRLNEMEITQSGKINVELNRQAKNQVEQEIKDLKKKLDDVKGNVEVSLSGTTTAAAQLAFLGRDRVVTFFANVNERSLATAEGALKSLGGLNVIDDAAQMLESLFTKFDQISMKAINISTVLGSIVDTLAYGVSATAAVGEGVVKSLGLLAAAPAILGAATVGYTIFTAAFNGFFDAFNKDPIIAKAALAELPPLARKTVDSITGLYKGLANPIQERFWTKVGTTLSDAIEHLYPNLKEQLLLSTDAVGSFVAGFGRSMTNLSLSGDLDKMFVGFRGFFENLSGASEPFFNAWNRFGVQGAQLLPMFGNWITENAKRFDEWSKSLGPDGIQKMIMDGVASLQAMWRVGKDIVSIFGAIAKASSAAGAGGLQEFERGLKRVADRMNSPIWQEKAANLFRGAREGASALMEGFRDLTGVISGSSQEFGKILNLLGSLGGAALTNLSVIFGVDDFQKGVTDALKGALQLMQDLRPAAESLGGIIGKLGTIAGASFGGVGDTINRMFLLVDSVLDKLSDNIIALVPKLANTLGAVFNTLTPLILGLTDGLNSILSVIAKIPDSFVGASVAAVAFFALRALGSKFFEALDGTSYFARLREGWNEQQVAAGRTRDVYRQVGDELKKVTVADSNFGATRAVFNDLTNSVGETRRTITGLYEQAKVDGLSPLRSAFSATTGVVSGFVGGAGRSLLGFLGGPWGLAFMAASIAVGSWAQSQEDAKAQAQSFSDSLDDQTGAITRTTTALIAANIVKDAHNGLFDFSGIKSGSETIGKLGKSIEETSDIVAKGGKPYEELIRLLKEGSAAYDQNTVKTDEFGRVTAGNANALTNWAAKLKISKDAINGMDLTSLIALLETERARVEGSQSAWDLRNDAIDTGQVRIENFNDAMRIYNDETATADARTRAFKDALDILNGKQLGVEDAQAKVNDSMRNANGVWREFSEIVDGQTVKTMKLVGGAFRDANGNVQVFNEVINASTGEIETISEAGSKFRSVLSETVSKVKDTTTAYKDQKKPASEIVAYLDQQRANFVKMGEAAGLNGDLVALAYDHMMGANPGELKTLITAEGVETADKKARDYGKTLQQLDDAKAVVTITGDDTELGEKLSVSYQHVADWDRVTAEATIGLNTEEAKAKKDELLLALLDLARTKPTIIADMDPHLLQRAKDLIMEQLADLNNQRPSPEVWAKTEDAQNLLKLIDDKLNAIGGKNPQPVVTPQTEEADRKLQATYDNVDRIGGQHPMPIVDPVTEAANEKLNATYDNVDRIGKQHPQPIVDAQTSEADSKMAATKSHLDVLGWARPKPFIDAQTADAMAKITLLQQQIDSMRGRDIRMSITTEYLTSGNPVAGAGQVIAPAANGAIFRNNVKTFANGGIERHVAQIASGRGPVRIWGEQETQGEAYIPYAQSKRPRSLSILTQVAKDFGYELTKAQKFSNGGFAGHTGPSTTNTASVTIGTLVTTDADAAVRKIRTSQQDALAVAGITLNGA